MKCSIRPLRYTRETHIHQDKMIFLLFMRHFRKYLQTSNILVNLYSTPLCIYRDTRVFSNKLNFFWKLRSFKCNIIVDLFFTKKKLIIHQPNLDFLNTKKCFVGNDCMWPHLVNSLRWTICLYNRGLGHWSVHHFRSFLVY